MPLSIAVWRPSLSFVRLLGPVRFPAWLAVFALLWDVTLALAPLPAPVICELPICRVAGGDASIPEPAEPADTPSAKAVSCVWCLPLMQAGGLLPATGGVLGAAEFPARAVAVATPSPLPLRRLAVEPGRARAPPSSF